MSRRAWTAICVVALIPVVAFTGIADFLGERDIERERVEQAVSSALIHQGVSASRVTCPGGLEKKTGAAMTCTYVDLLSDAVGTAILGEDREPPRTGRVEVVISGLEHRSFGPRASDSTSEPEFSVRIVDRAR